jgi:hypothetical protein
MTAWMYMYILARPFSSERVYRDLESSVFIRSKGLRVIGLRKGHLAVENKGKIIYSLLIFVTVLLMNFHFVKTHEFYSMYNNSGVGLMQDSRDYHSITTLEQQPGLG